MVTVFAPATVANVACGYDVLGFAIDGPGDFIKASFADKPGLRITHITGDDGKLPIDPEKNTATVAALDLLHHLGKTGLGIELEIHKRMPFSSGLGSSAASAVAGAFAVNALLGEPLSKKQLLPFAVTGEAAASGSKHADNVAPCLFGGIIFIRDNATLDFIELPVPDQLHAAVIYPEIEIPTKTAREILPTDFPLKNLTTQIGNLGALLSGLYTADYQLIGRSLHDHIAEPHRQKLIPEFYPAKQAALAAGALGFSISGAGPSVFTLSQGPATAQKSAEAISRIFSNIPLKNSTYLSPICPQGVRTVDNIPGVS
ncbi:MAG: homoserine kinase [Verrucomicrobiota bacterium]